MSKRVRESAEKCVFLVFYVPKGALLQQKLTEIDNTETWSVVQ